MLLTGRTTAGRRFLVEIQLDANGEPPTEFRLFKAGWNDTRNGRYLFDDRAARLTMAAFAEHRVELMIDLEHLAVAPLEVTGDARNFDPDARGWCSLEVRNGELWAVRVSWTEDGSRRLKKRTQRYVSPAFDVDEEMRVISIHNIALTAIPATDDAYPLVARSNEGTRQMKLSDFLKRWHKLSASQRALPAGDKLLELLAIDMKTLQAVVKAMGGDPAGDLTSLFSAVRSFAEELSASVTGEPAPSEPAGEPSDDAMLADIPAEEQEQKQQAARANARLATELELLRKDAAARDKELKLLQGEREARIQADRVELCRQAVRTGALTPGQVWKDGEADRPQHYLNQMTLDGIRALIVGGGGNLAPNLLVSPKPPASGDVFTGASGIEVSEYEAKRVEAALDKANERRKMKLSLSSALERYHEVRTQHYRGAEITGLDQNRFGRGIEQGHVIANIRGRIGPDEIKLLTTPVKPIETFGSTSQRAMEEFRTDYMVQLAVQLPDWVGQYGDVMTAGSLKDTYPLEFSAVDYQKRTASNAPAETPKAKEITVSKDEYRVAKMGDLKRITMGDFAYINSWQQGTAQFARARVKLRGTLIKTLLEAGAATAWIDGVNYFSATHKANPFKGTATWSNYQASATPLGDANLSEEKAAMLLVRHFDEQFISEIATAMLIPTVLAEKARLMLTVQDLIMDGTGTAGIRSDNYGSGFAYTIAPQLTGTDATADYYLISEGVIAQGFTPWVVSEDGAEEILEWDINSDFYKESGNIKIESKLYISAALLWAQGIRLVKGA